MSRAGAPRAEHRQPLTEREYRSGEQRRLWRRHEYVNFAFIQMDGVPFPAGSPSPLGPVVSTNAQTLFMNSGDELEVILQDAPNGLKIAVNDLTSGQSGFMVSSAANGFAEILYDPNGKNCDFATHNIPYDFHPMYATSTEHTRVPWTAHAFNVGLSDEVGHFQYCDAVAKQGGHCTQPSVNDRPARMWMTEVASPQTLLLPSDSFPLEVVLARTTTMTARPSGRSGREP